MPRTRKATLGALGATLCATVLVGTAGTAHAQDDNGVAKESATDIANRAVSAFNDARSLHVTTERTGSGLSRTDATSLDVSADRDNNCVGTVGFAADGGSLEVVRHADKVWLKADAAWLRNNLPAGESQDVQKLEGKFLQGTTQDQGLSDLARICSINEYRDTLKDATSAGTLKKGSETTVDGKPVIDVTGKHDGMDLTLSVSTQGKPFPVRATSKGDGDSQTTNFTFDQPVPDKTPPAGETVPWGG
ncbi:hypothetical protein AA958_15585 [Streptomyces sp. CNQ-509]|uniref:hypothetical protein n=1 Tax=unclassified Streptomyces TaxID=2593676 RepID=UPI00062DFBA9|nr:hypothetical protein [Streptomyces sp. CNQ-509]AKH83395.1 hypothetical protein AA958_15585 [Streptomyces sp. CNQ-509]